MKKRILSLFLAFMIGVTSFGSLPVAADTTSARSIAQTESELLESTQFKENMTFLILLNHARINKGMTPLAVTPELLLASQTRAKEMETLCAFQRPNNKGNWYDVLTEYGIISQDTLNYYIKLQELDRRPRILELNIAGSVNPANIYEKCMDEYSGTLYRSNLILAGLGHTNGACVIKGELLSNPWALHLLGLYTPVSLEVVNAPSTPCPTGMSLTDMGIVLRLNVKSPEGKEYVSYLPLLQGMCEGYSTSSGSGTHTVTVTYKYTAESTPIELKTSFTLTTAKAISPEKPASFEAKGVSYNEVKVTWSPVANANEYELYRSTKKKSGYKKIATLKPRKLTLTEDGLYTYTDEGRTSGTSYYYKIRATIGSSKSDFTKYDEGKPNIDAPTNLKVSSKKKTSIKVKWSKVSHATSYRVYYATKKNGKYKRATNKSTSKTSYTIKKLKKGKTYYIKVLSYRNGKPGKYSKILKVKTKK